MSLKQETKQVSKIEVPCENEKTKETPVLERCPHCGRLKTPKHQSFQYDKRSTYQRDTIICIDYTEDGTKIVYEKELSDPLWKQPLINGVNTPF